MTRIIALATAAALVAGSAFAQDAIRVSTAGKSPEQLKAEVHQAALKVCRAEINGYAFRIDEARACVERTERDTFAQSQELGARVAAAR